MFKAHADLYFFILFMLMNGGTAIHSRTICSFELIHFISFSDILTPPSMLRWQEEIWRQLGKTRKYSSTITCTIVGQTVASSCRGTECDTFVWLTDNQSVTLRPFSQPLSQGYIVGLIGVTLNKVHENKMRYLFSIWWLEFFILCCETYNPCTEYSVCVIHFKPFFQGEAVRKISCSAHRQALCSTPSNKLSLYTGRQMLLHKSRAVPAAPA